MQPDEFISLRAARAILPRVDGKRVNYSTLRRWTREGVHGVRLETVRIGTRVATTRAALERFLAETAAAAPGGPPAEHPGQLTFGDPSDGPNPPAAA